MATELVQSGRAVLGPISWERMVAAVEKVRARLLRAAAALEGAGVPYAVCGGSAVAAWVSRVDESAVRNTQDVNILLRREDLDRAKQALEAAGFIYRRTAGIEMFLDGVHAKPREAVHVLFANERVRTDHQEPAPDVAESEFSSQAQFRCISLPSLVRMKLTSFRDKDRVHLRDLIDVGLVDASFVDQLPRLLAQRLRDVLENPEG